MPTPETPSDDRRWLRILGVLILLGLLATCAYTVGGWYLGWVR